MKVLHFINTLSAGGAELHLLTLCRYLKRAGLDLRVACLREHVRGSRSLRPAFEEEDIEVINLRADSRYDVRFLVPLARLIERESPDILHTHLPRADIGAAVAFRLASAPALLCSVHGIYRERWFGSAAAPFMRWAYRRANAVIAISDAVKDWLHQDLAICRGKVQVIHYGIEPERFTSVHTGERKCGTLEGAPVVGSIGRLEAGKGFDCLIRAMAMVSERVPRASLRIAGHDPTGYAKTLEAVIAKSNLKEQARLIGFQDDIASFLHGLDVFAFASRSEGFGQVVIEAMAAGKPVVASRIPPLTEIVADGETGLLADPDDPASFAAAILSLVRDPEQARQIGKRGQARVGTYFSAQRMADDTVRLYENVMRMKRDGQVSLQ